MAGLVVIDFIDMESNGHIRKVEKAMKEALKNDRARIQVGRISSFGLMEMSRQRLRTGVLEASTRPCPHCDGSGLMRTAASSGLSALRMIEDEAARGRGSRIILRAGREAAIYVLNRKRTEIGEIEERYGVLVEVLIEESFEGARMAVESLGPPPVQRPRPAPMAEPEVDEEEIADEAFDEEEDEEEAEEAPREARAPREPRGDRPERGERGEEDRNGRKRRRRRGRRGGRRRGPDGEELPEGSHEQGEDFPSDAEPAEGGEAAPVTEVAEAAPVAEVPAEAETGEEKPKARRRPRARRKGADEAPAEAAPEVVAEPAPASEPQPEPVAEAAEAPAKPKRSRRKKADAEAAPAAEEAAPAAEAAPEAPAPAPANDIADNGAAAGESDAGEGQSTGPRRSGWWQRTFGA
jgi:ribonuclease E